MSIAKALPGSFRDPSGHVYEIDGQIIRTVSNAFAPEFEFMETSGLLQKLINDGQLLPFERHDSGAVPHLGFEDTKYTLRIPRLRFVSYPYEWPFSALKAAALLHLKMHLIALDFGATLTDASAYNVQFQGAKPVFIDHLSFRRYRPGEIWIGHRQFCEQFLNPLLLRAYLGVPHNAWYRGTQEGISAKDLSRILKWRHFLNWTTFTHVLMQAFFQRSVENDRVTLRNEKLPDNTLTMATQRRILRKLQSWISNLRPAKSGKTTWKDYSRTHSYSSDEIGLKKTFIKNFVQTVRPKLIWDMGCNTGDYAVAALDAGAQYAVGFDNDQDALELAYARASEQILPFQTVFLDAANPSPGQGWREQERFGLKKRASADAVIALALVHHLAISRNIPLDQLLHWLIELAPKGVIEFVPKDDPMTQALLRHREDIFPDYTEDGFVNAIENKAKITNRAVVSSSGRLLISYVKRQ